MEYLEQLFNQLLAQLSYHSFGVMGMIMLIFALLNCFLGYRLMKLWIAVIGFCIGLLAGVGLASIFTENSWILLAAAVVGGILIALIAFKVYLVGVFLYGAIVAYGLIVGLIGQDKWWSLAVCVIFALLVGILAVNYVRPSIIITTAISGGFTAAKEVLSWLSVADVRITYALAIVLAALGIFIQFRHKDS